MIGGMKFHLVQARSVAVEGLKLRRIAIGQDSPFLDLARSRSCPEFRQPLGVGGASRRSDGSLQRPIDGEEIDVLEWRRLIDDVMGFKMRGGTQRAHAGRTALFFF